jgi:NAD(P)-dependent dehydrogenase (short-subunit alcohol dehydrogenase family)
MRVALAARNEHALEEVAATIRQTGGNAVVVPTDVTDTERCRQAVETTVEQLGRLDLLLCCAGISMRSLFAEADPQVLERVMRVNFFGTMHTTWHAIPHLRQTRGSLVAISSLTGKRGTPFYSIYGASKFAIQGLFDSLRMELAEDGVHVGIVDTPLRENVLGPDGHPFASPPALPFRLWPLDRCVARLVRLIQRREREALLPAFVGPLLVIEQMLGISSMGDRMLLRRFNTCATPSPAPISKRQACLHRPSEEANERRIA